MMPVFARQSHPARVGPRKRRWQALQEAVKRSMSLERRGHDWMEDLEGRLLLSTATVTVNATASVHAINPLIYGTNTGTTADIQTLGLTGARDGGNAADTYNWQLDATNHGSDWYFESIGNGGSNGAGIDSYINSAKAGGATPQITVDIMGYAAMTGSGNANLGSYPVSVYGAQQQVDPYRTNFGNGVTTGGAKITDTNITYNYVVNTTALEQAWLQHINGNATFFVMGNEPALWNSTHRDLHNAGERYTELMTDTQNYASMIKTVNPNAKVLGPEEWGWTGYTIDGYDASISNWGATYGGLNVEQWYLQQLQAYQTAHGVRLLDYFTNHIYPQASNVYGNAVDTATETLRNATTRDLWDSSYTDPSWINTQIQLIPRMQSWVNSYYPGTKVGITEYNWGADGNMNGATAQADIWGIFGKYSLDMGDRWGAPAAGTPTYLAMQLWRNYDGAHSAFGETSVSDTVANPDLVASYAATRAADGALTVTLINKTLYTAGDPTTTITVNLSNFNANATAGVWRVAATSPTNQTVATLTHPANINVSSNSATITVPDESVTMLVFTPASGVPAQVTGLNATPGNAQVALTWNTASGATSYDIYRSTTPGGEGTTPYLTGVTPTNYTNTGLTNGQIYYYQVTGVNGSGQGAKSSEVSATPTNGSLPTGWSDADIGAPANAGSATYASGTWTVKGGGADIWNTSDQFNMASESLNGDGTIIAKVSSITNTNSWAKAGVMIRGSTAANAQEVSMLVTPGNGVTFQYRASAGGSSASAQVTGIVAPEWVKLVRLGNNFSAYYSATGLTWTQCGTTQAITMSNPVLMGLAVTSHDNTQLATGTFTNVNVTGATALSRTGWVASASLNNSIASSAIDGNSSTRWDTGVYQANGQWFTMKLGSQQAVDRLVLDTTATPTDYPVGYQVFASNDGSTWGSAIATGSGSGAVTTINFTAVSAQYFKVVQTGTSASYWWSIYEFNAYFV